MVEIEFSVMENLAGDANRLRPLLEAFEQQYHIHVNLVGIPWDRGWAEIAQFGIYGHGPDVSSIGTTWVGSLASMHALRPFSAQEVRAMGGAEAFFEANWQLGFLPDDPEVWSIPWLGDAKVLYYRKDAFEKAGIKDVAAALGSDTALAETLQQLQTNGHPYPLALTTGKNPVILHETAHWIWNAGGEFMSPDYRRVAFNQPAALEGLRKYFNLKPFLSPESFSNLDAEQVFAEHGAVLVAAGPWLGMAGRDLHPEWSEDLGISPLPGKAFVGGCNFVIWEYSMHPREAFELVQFLGLQPAHFPASPHDHLVPTRHDVIQLPVAQDDIFNRTYLQALQSGKGFPTIRLWGSIEGKLINTIADIWAERNANLDEDLDTCLHRRLDPLAERLNVVLGN
jgi:multiple sugar transport system substrate-binding protein